MSVTSKAASRSWRRDRPNVGRNCTICARIQSDLIPSERAQVVDLDAALHAPRDRRGEPREQVRHPRVGTRLGDDATSDLLDREPLFAGFDVPGQRAVRVGEAIGRVFDQHHAAWIDRPHRADARAHDDVAPQHDAGIVWIHEQVGQGVGRESREPFARRREIDREVGAMLLEM